MGDKVYVEKVKDQMGYKAIGCRVIETRDSFVLKEMQHPYQSISARAYRVRQEDNTIYWQNEPKHNPDINMSLEE